MKIYKMSSHCLVAQWIVGPRVVHHQDVVRDPGLAYVFSRVNTLSHRLYGWKTPSTEDPVFYCIISRWHMSPAA